jgi:hypothetical protein
MITGFILLISISVIIVIVIIIAYKCGVHDDIDDDLIVDYREQELIHSLTLEGDMSDEELNFDF